MADKWYAFETLLSRDLLKACLARNEENLTAAGREIGCSIQSVRTAMGKHMVLLTKDKETATRDTMNIKIILRRLNA